MQIQWKCFSFEDKRSFPRRNKVESHSNEQEPKELGALEQLRLENKH